MECEGVAEAVVVGMPDNIKGLVLVAFIILCAGCQPS
jgi:acetyl-CoA synthetase